MEIIITKIVTLWNDIFKNCLNIKAKEKLQIKRKVFSSLIIVTFIYGDLIDRKKTVYCIIHLHFNTFILDVSYIYF